MLKFVYLNSDWSNQKRLFKLVSAGFDPLAFLNFNIGDLRYWRLLIASFLLSAL
ncbi:hypothetical protein SAMN04487792_0652 [Lactobacillus bombicola]|uniref:Uncharacterized protein n=1 Tax=Lactobacillus bombicola TaxID=1505723 RepID=A0A1I1RXE4_9LACO|nr:hypothetical protein SAMN04487792_0652 [Lactobacillus bombicola]